MSKSGGTQRAGRRAATESTRTGMSAEAIRLALLDNLFFVLGRFPEVASNLDYYQALAYTVRDRLLDRWVRSAQAYKSARSRTVCYLSAEYLPGPHLAINLLNLGITEPVREAVRSLGLDLDELIEQEEDPGLGNGGLGRLAACFMDSLAALEIPAIGYGIRYEFGIFDQAIRDGWQAELTDSWLRDGNPWELRRPKIRFEVGVGGHTESYTDEHRNYRVRWIPSEVISGVAYDTPILGYGVGAANLLRLWNAEAQDSFDLHAFNLGDYYGAVQRKTRSETVSKVLYPNDEPEIGKRLRLIQQHFFVSCSLQDMIRIHRQSDAGIDILHEKFTVQLNDTHPAIAVAELMRLLLDEHGFGWDAAWKVTRSMFAYTNHTLLPEALEKWPVPLFESVLPRHLQIVYEINRRLLDEVRMRHPEDAGLVARLSLIDETPPRYVRMANLACAGSHSINGVAALHTRLLADTVLSDVYRLWPEKFSNKTNGVTPRRFLMLSNPGLSGLITEAIGETWKRDLGCLRDLEPLAGDAAFQARWRQVKAERKAALAEHARRLGLEIDPGSLFDIQAKRIHEYKRQHLNVLHIVTLYNRIKRDPSAQIVPRTFAFAGKAAPGYAMAKLIIKLINSVAEVINRDPEVAGRLRVVFIPDLNVKLGQRIYPAADLSEQISTAGKEASGTGNMKFAMNGALTIGTLDGANVEIRDAVGAENFFLFGLNADQVRERRAGGYRPREIYDSNPELRQALDLIAGGLFSHGDTGLFRWLVDDLIGQDEYFVLADYQSYVDCQDGVARAHADPVRWTRMSILNTARIGQFSSDRTIREYCRDIWQVESVPIPA